MTRPHSSLTPTSVYRYFDEHNLLLYVGITSRGMARNMEHNHSKDWWQFVAYQQVEHFPSRKLAQDRERDLIRQFHPPFNVQHNVGYQDLQEMYLHFRKSQIDPARHSGKRLLVLDFSLEDDTTVMLRSRFYDAPIVFRMRGLTEKFHHSVFGGKGKLKNVDLEGGQLRAEIQLTKPGLPRSAFAKWAHSPDSGSDCFLKMIGLHMAKVGESDYLVQG